MGYMRTPVQSVVEVYTEEFALPGDRQRNIIESEVGQNERPGLTFFGKHMDGLAFNWVCLL